MATDPESTEIHITCKIHYQLDDDKRKKRTASNIELFESSNENSESRQNHSQRKRAQMQQQRTKLEAQINKLTLS
jgi:hypothetical protein